MTKDCIWFNKSNFVPKEKNSKYHLTVIRFYRGRVLNNYDIPVIINFYELRDFERICWPYKPAQVANNEFCNTEINPLEKGGFGVLSTETGFD